MTDVRTFARGVLRAVGLRGGEAEGGDTVAVPPDMWAWLAATRKIRTVLDIGANDGSFAEFLAKRFNAASTHVFEPVPACLPALKARRRRIRDLRIHNVALADTRGRQRMFQNNYVPASSLLRVSQVTKDEFPQTGMEEPITVDVARLDDILRADSLEKEIFIKLDVQGMEGGVIAGGRRVFGIADCVLIEMSFVEMYEGQPLFEEVHAQLMGLGFCFAGMKNQVRSPRTGQPLFLHGLYVRDSTGARA